MTPRLAPLLLLALVGCGPSLTVSLPAADPVEPVEHDRFDPATAGTISGVATWAGNVPVVEPIHVSRFEGRGWRTDDLPNPNAPRVADGRVASAVVFLRGVDPRRAKPITAPPTEVELDATGVAIRQAGERLRTAFVPAGAEVAITNKLAGIGGVRGRGAVFFATMLPDAGSTARRTLVRPGRVELTSASGQFWAVADLFVCQHAYHARPDAAGRFAFADVPAGEYELVAWHPNWHVAATERDPETGVLARQRYGPAAEVTTRVRVAAGGTTTAAVTLSAADFR